jgi:tetratricopeptide (TPR) repeat protein
MESGDKTLIALANLLDAELQLWKGDEEGARKALAVSIAGSDVLSGMPRDRARSYRVAGAAAKALGDYPAALNYLARAADIDLKEKSYTEYASDRYLTASVHSKLGAYPAAHAALIEALNADRRAEHAAGIGGDYYALGLVAEKSGDAEMAASYFLRAADVFRAARLEEKAVEAEQRRDAVTKGPTTEAK